MDLPAMAVIPDPLCQEGNMFNNWQKFKLDFTNFLISTECDEKPDKVKVAKLWNIIGDGGRQTISNLGLQNSVNYDDMMKTLDDWAETQRHPAYVRQEFYNRVQNEGESFESFLNDVKNLISPCNFGERADEFLCDKILTGVSNCPLKRLFRTEPNISLVTAVQMCRGADLSLEQVLKLLVLKRMEKKSDGVVHQISFNGPQFSKLIGYHMDQVEEYTYDCTKNLYSQPVEINGNRSESTIRLILKNVSKLETLCYYHSPSCYIRNLPWRISCAREIDNDDEYWLACFVECQVSQDTSWSCSATCEIRLFPQKEDKEVFSSKIKHVFCSEENYWKFDQFILWKNLLNPKEGYIKEDSITLEVLVSADAPSGVDL